MKGGAGHEAGGRAERAWPSLAHHHVLLRIDEVGAHAHAKVHRAACVVAPEGDEARAEVDVVPRRLECVVVPWIERPAQARDWTVESARIEGFAGNERYRHAFTRDEQGWLLDGEPMGLPGLVDLDFGFTPATNFQQLHRLGLGVGEQAAIDVAWFDVGQGRIIALPQIYKRLAEDRYAYEAPTSDYRAELAIAPSGFVADYPGLWRMAN